MNISRIDSVGRERYPSLVRMNISRIYFWKNESTGDSIEEKKRGTFAG